MLDCREVTDLFLMTLCVWREARGETKEAQIAVAHSILNRVNHPKWWGNSISAVVTRKWQYSSMTDPHDPQLTTWPVFGDASWASCFDAAVGALSGSYENPVPGADSYHDTSIQPPSWAATSHRLEQIGHLVFYDTDGDGVV